MSTAHRIHHDLYRADKVLKDPGDAKTIRFTEDLQICEMVSTTTIFPTRCKSILDDRDPVFFERMKPFMDRGSAVAFVGTTHVGGLAGMFEGEGYLIRREKS